MKEARSGPQKEADEPGDDAHVSHREFLSGPAQEALRARVHADRRRLPAVLRSSFWAALALGALSLLLIVTLAIFDLRTLGVVTQMFGLSFAVGREAAMLYAYGHQPSLGPVWVTAVAVLDDLLTLGLTLPLVWIGVERLRGVYLVGGIVLSIEKTAVEKRAFLQRWGLYGLVAFIWFPGVGAGIFLAAAIGIVSKMPLRRLIVALALGSLAVNLFWGIALFYTSGLIPSEGTWSYIPLAFVAGLGVLAALFGWLARRKRHLFPLVKVQILGRQHVARLAAVGITDGIDLLYVNRRTLAARLGIDPALLGRLRSVAELSLLRSVSPRHAEMLTQVGITSIRELSVAPPELVAAALHELELKHVTQPLPGEEETFPTQCQQWTADAKVFLAEATS